MAHDVEPNGDINRAPYRVAHIDGSGRLRMEKDMKDHRDGVKAYLAEIGDEEEAPEPAEAVAGGIPPCPPEDPRAGDKTPAVVEWMFRYHPEDAAKRYAGRKVTLPNL